MSPWLALLIGVICAGIGGELFVRGAVGLAKWARISAGIIGATVAAFATSSPELSVAIGSSVAGQPEISFGNALGSNIVNIAVILGMALCISGIQAPRASVRRDFPVALLVPIVLGVLSLDGRISRVDGILLLTLFLGWLIAVAIAAHHERSASGKILGAPSLWRAALAALVGLGFLVGSGHFIVAGARGIAVDFGIPEFIIGATVVAIGTTTPELATVIISKLRNHEEVGLGTILGSNIFNGLFIVGVASVICPIQIEGRAAATALILGLATTALTFPPAGGFIERRRGAMLLALYVIYVVALISR